MPTMLYKWLPEKTRVTLELTTSIATWLLVLLMASPPRERRRQQQQLRLLQAQEHPIWDLRPNHCLDRHCRKRPRHLLNLSSMRQPAMMKQWVITYLTNLLASRFFSFFAWSHITSESQSHAHLCSEFHLFEIDFFINTFEIRVNT